MRRRTFTIFCGASPLVGSRGLRAQQANTGRRIGELWPGVENQRRRDRDAFRRRLGELGHVEGRTLTIHERYAEGRLDRLPELARQLVDLKVEVVVAVSLPAAEAARKATTAIPIVMVHGANSADGSLFSTLARPGGNVTGTVSTSGELGGKYFELLREIVPSASRVTVIFNPDNAGAREALAAVMATAGTFAIEPVPVEVRRAVDLDRALADILGAKPDAALVYVEALVYNNRRRIIDFMARERLPALYSLSWVVPDGGLLSYGANLSAHYPRAADCVAKILRGARPGELPIEQSAIFELFVNFATAKALGITIPPAVLARADEVIE
jgi:putative ABC transport system substrate-binding protein